MRWIVFVLVMFMGVWNGVAEADFQDGNELHANCTTDTYVHKGMCLGYTTAIADVMRFQAVNNFRACMSSSVTAGQVKDIVVKSLREHPQHRHLQ